MQSVAGKYRPTKARENKVEKARGKPPLSDPQGVGQARRIFDFQIHAISTFY